jgi:hypothetical protein
MNKIASLVFIFLSSIVFAAPGDTIHVQTHSNLVVRTNPAAGNSGYPAWADFPAQGTNIHKAWISLSFKCPTGENCGEWDYLDYIYLRRKGGAGATSENIELARFITPYGNSYTATWFADWEVDVTDFEQLLRDSIEVEYIHGGYETNVGRGWLMNLTFHFIEGTPVRELKQVHRLWNGGFGYGNAANPINSQLTEQTLNLGADAATMRLRIIQSGHGADDPDYCAEFCPKQRTLTKNGSTLDQRIVWRDDCGLNPVFPQAGTWIYDRGNWCPGDIVYPDVFDFEVAPNSTQTLGMQMESYTGSGGANYVVQAYALEYAAPAFAVDASIDDIKAPSKRYSYRRFNPICGKPEIVVMNNGSSTINSIEFSYGPSDGQMSTYTWNGSIDFMKKETIFLPANVQWNAEQGTFKVQIVKVNGQSDEYALNNTYYSEFEAPLGVPDVFVVNFKTNNVPQENYWTIFNANGDEVTSRSSFEANTEYKDTLTLPWGCYTFVLEDTDKDGLSFWNNDDGTGFVRFRKGDTGSIFKAFSGDFGTRLVVPFTVGGSIGFSEASSLNADFSVFPNPANNQIHVEAEFNKTQDVTIALLDLSGKVLQSALKKNISNLSEDFSISDFASGIYILEVTTQQGKWHQKLVVQH